MGTSLCIARQNRNCSHPHFYKEVLNARVRGELTAPAHDWLKVILKDISSSLGAPSPNLHAACRQKAPVNLAAITLAESEQPKDVFRSQA